MKEPWKGYLCHCSILNPEIIISPSISGRLIAQLWYKLISKVLIPYSKIQLKVG